MKRYEYRVVVWFPNTFSGGGEYSACPDEIFTSKAAAIKMASYSLGTDRVKIQRRVRGSGKAWCFIDVKIPLWEWRVRRASKARRDAK